MNEANLQQKLNELVKEIGGPADLYYCKLATLATQAQEERKQPGETVNNLQESLDYLRICIKYHLFDLEATRRENSYLRKLLEEKGS